MLGFLEGLLRSVDQGKKSPVAAGWAALWGLSVLSSHLCQYLISPSTAMPQGKEPRSPSIKVQQWQPSTSSHTPGTSQLHVFLHCWHLAGFSVFLSPGHSEISLTFYLWITKMSNEIQQHGHKNPWCQGPQVSPALPSAVILQIQAPSRQVWPSRPGEAALWLLHGLTRDWEVFKTWIYF